MEISLDSQLEDLKQQILVMGGRVEQALALVLAGLSNRDIKQLKSVHEIEVKINEEQIQVDNTCINILAKHRPVARDLRFILSVVKINTDLERMGDQTVNISFTGKDYLSRAALMQVSDIYKMAEITKDMVTRSLDSFVRGDTEAAKKVLAMDDEVDEYKNKIFRELTAHVRQSPQAIEAALDLILIARNLERLGDHATNIAEDVIFAFTGQDVRHGGGAHGNTES